MAKTPIKNLAQLTDLTAKQFERITVIEYAGSRNGRGALWKCQCNCGNPDTFIIRGDSLKGGLTRSCGCLAREHSQKPKIRQRKYNTLTIDNCYGKHSYEAKKRGFTPILKDEWLKIVLLPCFYCGKIDTRNPQEYRQKAFPKMTQEDIKKYEKQINGLDRINSSKPYTTDNIVPCCTMCNWMKNSFMQEEFLNKIKEIHDNLNLGSK